MTKKQQWLLVVIKRFGFWCMAIADVFGTYYVLDLFFPTLKHYGGYPISGEVAFSLALTLWMITWLMWILETGLKKHFKKSSQGVPS